MTTDRTRATAVTERLDELESQNRRLRLAFIAIALGISAVFLTAAMPSTKETVTAQKFVLVDATGKVWADLTLSPGGGPGLELFDTDGNVRAHLGLVAGLNPRLQLYGGSDRSGAAVFIDGGETRALSCTVPMASSGPT